MAPRPCEHWDTSVACGPREESATGELHLRSGTLPMPRSQWDFCAPVNQNASSPWWRSTCSLIAANKAGAYCTSLMIAGAARARRNSAGSDWAGARGSGPSSVTSRRGASPLHIVSEAGLPAWRGPPGIGKAKSAPTAPLAPGGGRTRGQGPFVAKTYMAKMAGMIAAQNLADGVCFRLELQRVVARV